MTVDKLKKVLLEAKPQKIANWFKDKSESERSKFQKPIEEFQYGLDRWHAKKSNEWKVLEELESLGYDQKAGKDILYKFEVYSPPFVCFEVACRPVSKLKELNFVLSDESVGNEWGDGEAWDRALLKILKDRRLSKIDSVVDSLIANRERESGGYIEPAFILLAVEKGVIKQPDSPQYLEVLSDIFDPNGLTDKQWERNRKLVMKNKAFRERDAYLLLQTETDMLWNPAKDNFKEIYRVMMKAKYIDRARVLQSVVQALYLDSRKNILQAAVRYLKELDPKPFEWVEMVGDIKGLLASRHSFIGKFAFESLKQLHADALLTDEELVGSLGAAFQCPTKGLPKSVITTIKKVAKSNDGCVPIGINGALLALQHSESEVQAVALKWLETVKSRLHRDHISEIREQVDQLAATNRKAARGLVGVESDEAVKSGSREKAVAAEVSDTTTAAVAAEFQLDACEPIAPIPDHETLIDAIAKALEVVESGREAERILEGICRLGPVPSDLEKRAAPVLATAIEKKSSYYGQGGDEGLTSAPDATPRFRRVVCLALGMKELLEPLPDFQDEEEARDFGYEWPLVPCPMDLPDYSPKPCDETSPGYVQRSLAYAWRSRLLWQRLESIEKRLVDGTTLPMLCAPTHHQGWVEPAVFVDRLGEYLESKCFPCPADLSLGFLRLLPIGREKALAKCSKQLGPKDSEILGALILAMEGPTAKIKPLKKTPTCWQVAAHVRTKELLPEELTRLGLDSDFANGRLKVVRSWRVNDKKTSKNTRQWEVPYLVDEVQLPKWMNDDRVLQEVYRVRNRELNFSSHWRVEMDAWNDPVCRDSYWIEAMNRMLERLENGPARQAPNAAFFECLFDPNYQWEETACGAVVVAMLGKDTDASRVAIDAMIESIPRKSVSVNRMGVALIRVFNSPLAKPKRFAERFVEVAGASPEHRAFVAASLDRLIAGWARPEKELNPTQIDRFAKAADCGPILDLCLESMTELGVAPEPETVVALQDVAAKGKVGKAIKSIIGLAKTG